MSGVIKRPHVRVPWSSMRLERSAADLWRSCASEGDIVVVGQPNGAADAIEQVTQLRPDVVILDLHLRGGQSQHAIEQIMARTPTPILILSARIDDRHSPSAVQALVAGALEALPRPRQWTPELGAELRRTVRLISTVHVIRHPRGGLAQWTARGTAPQPERQPVVAIAASTGGPSALATILSGLAGLQAPVLVVQHLHADFVAGLVDWMSRVSALPVETAEHRIRSPAPGRIYLAPGGTHLRLGANRRLELARTPVTVHRPSADELFKSVADSAGSAGIGVLLTGMGDDGAQGLLAIRRQGGVTLAQDEASSAVFGMPKAAERLGAVTEMLPLGKLAAGHPAGCAAGADMTSSRGPETVVDRVADLLLQRIGLRPDPTLRGRLRRAIRDELAATVAKTSTTYLDSRRRRWRCPAGAAEPGHRSGNRILPPPRAVRGAGSRRPAHAAPAGQNLECRLRQRPGGIQLGDAAGGAGHRRLA